MNRRRSGNKCYFLNCGKTRRDDGRAEQWILNSGNATLLSLSPDSLKKRQICEDHFAEEDFTAKKRLKKTAVPLPYSINPVILPSTSHQSDGVVVSLCSHTCSVSPSGNTSPPGHIKVLTPKKVYQKYEGFPRFSPQPSTSREQEHSISPATRKIIEEISDMPVPDVSVKRVKRKLLDSPRKMALTIEKQKKILGNKRSIISKMKKKLNQKQLLLAREKTGQTSYVSESSKIIADMQTMHRFNTPWTKKEREFAMKLYYKSPKAYKYLRNSEHVILPSVSIIRKWIGNSKFKPGFSAKLFYHIKQKVKVMSEEEKYCTIVFDKMKIKKYLEYSKYLDLIEGFQDLGKFGRSNQFGTQAMVFIARGIYSNWKMPLAYFICGNSMKHITLKEIILEAVQRSIDIGLYVTAIVCDQGTNNQAALKNLGVTSQKPYFEIEDKKIFSIFDVPHIMKNIRNNFLHHDLNINGQIVSFNDIRKTYEIDLSSSTGRSLIKLTPEHLDPGPFKKMSCKLALQIFSNSVAATIRTVYDNGQLQSDTAIATAEFIEIIKNLFDCLNSKMLYSKNIYNKALSDKNPLIERTICEAKEILENMTKITNKGPTRPASFDGLVWSINAILGLYQKQKNLGFTYILTNRLNQDIIENTFARYRQRGGYNVNPTVRTFRTTFRMNAKMNLMKPSKLSNCEDDEDDLLIMRESSDHLAVLAEHHSDIGQTVDKYPSPSSSVVTSSDSIDSESLDLNIEIPQGSLEDCSNVYFSGYIAKKCFDKFKCLMCKNIFNSEDELLSERDLLILHKTYPSSQKVTGLTVPTRQFVDFIEKGLLLIKHYITENACSRNILKKIDFQLKEKYDNLSEILDDNCEEHLQFIRHHLITVKLYKECKWLTNSEKFDKEKKKIFSKNSKLNILMNV